MDYPNLNLFQRTDNSWICRKCGRSYGPMMQACGPCNKQIDARAGTPDNGEKA